MSSMKGSMYVSSSGSMYMSSMKGSMGVLTASTRKEALKYTPPPSHSHHHPSCTGGVIL